MSLGPDAFVQALADVQKTVDDHRRVAHQLLKVLEPAHSAARLHTLHLTAGAPTTTDAADHGAKSFTVVNPYSFAIRLGIGGVGASNVAAYTVPPTSAVTLPITAENLEIGALASDLAAGDVYVFAFTYRTVQPFFFAEWA